MPVDPTSKAFLEKAIVHLQRAILEWDSESRMRQQLHSAAGWLERAVARMREARTMPAQAKPVLSPIIVKLPAGRKATRNRRRGSPGEHSRGNQGDKDES